MNQSPANPVRLKLILLAVLSLISADFAGAQTYFTQTGFGDLVASFRKTGSFAENNEMAVYLGNVTNFLSLSVGTTINITNYAHAQIANMSPDNLANLQWSVFSSVQTIGFPEGPWVTPIGSFPKATCWITIPRSDLNTQTTPLNRYSYAANGSGLRPKILGVSQGARSISQSLVTTNQFNNTLVVVEPVGNSDHIISAYIGDPSDPTFGDFGGSPLVYGVNTVESTTPDPFSAPVRCDFYQFCPTGVGLTDPFTGKTNGAAYFVGYFTLNTDGTMTFTRAATSTVTNPPPAPVLSILTSITGTGGNAQLNAMISFGTTNGATYSLRYTNASGLTAPVANWPVAPGTVAGDGSVHSFTNSSGDPSRFYRVTAQ